MRDLTPLEIRREKLCLSSTIDESTNYISIFRRCVRTLTGIGPVDKTVRKTHVTEAVLPCNFENGENFI